MSRIQNIPNIFPNVALLVIVTIVAFSPSFDNSFVNWDDQFYITANPLINNPSWNTLQELLFKVVSLNFHPLTMISLWVNSVVSGVESASPFILTNVLIHTFNTLLVFLLIYQLSERKMIAAIFTAILFAIHPMHIESVVWASERKDVLYAFFFLVSLLCYWNYLIQKSPTKLVLCFFFFLMSCLSKAMAVSLVPCLFGLDYLKSRNFKSPLLYLEKIPFVILALLIGYVAINIQGGGDLFGLLDLSESANAMKPSEISLIDRILNASFANFYYVSNFILPLDQSPFHPYILKNAYSPIWYALSTLLLIGILLWAIKNKYRNITFGLAFYFSTIALVLQFIPVGSAIVAERYTYLPYIGLAFATGLFLQKLWEHGYKFLIYLSLPILCLVLLIKTRIQCDVWQNHVSLFNQAVEVYPEDPFSRKTLASGLFDQGKIDEAIYHTEYAINQLGFISSSAFELLANCYAEKNEPRKAISFFNEAIKLDNTNVIARYHRGIELIEIDPQKAILDFNYCEDSNNEYVKPLLHSPRGRAFGLLGNYLNALDDLNKAIEYFPNDINNHLDKAITLENLNRIKEAKEVYQQILALNQYESQAIERLNILKKTKIK